MKSTVYHGVEARDFLPEFIGTNYCTVISPIRDYIDGGDKLGHLIIFNNKQNVKKGQLYFENDLTDNQIKYGIKGSFVFIGTNPNYFNSLFENVITGKFNDSAALIDEKFSGIVSYKFKRIFKHYLFGEVHE